MQKTRNLDMIKEKANLMWYATKLVVKNTVEEGEDKQLLSRPQSDAHADRLICSLSNRADPALQRDGGRVVD
jgi:hypothetical protein